MNVDRHARAMLLIPDRPVPGLTTYDAKDPETRYPPIEPRLPPEGALNVLIALFDDVGDDYDQSSIPRNDSASPSPGSRG